VHTCVNLTSNVTNPTAASPLYHELTDTILARDDGFSGINEIHALLACNGSHRRVWRSATPITDSVLGQLPVLYVATSTKSIYALRIEDGSVIWNVTLTTSFAQSNWYVSLLDSERLVYAHIPAAATTYKLNASTGTQRLQIRLLQCCLG
jgi:outer membrane protein assembly factor BamB